MITAAQASQIEQWRAQATPASVPGGVLVWWGRSDFPDGSAGGVPLTQTEWQNNYVLLQGAALAPGIVTPLFEITPLTKDLWPDGPLPVAIANFRFGTPGRDYSGVVERRAFMAAPLMHDQWQLAAPVYRSRRVTLSIERRFYFAAPGDPLPDAISIDAADGLGFRRVAFDSSLAVEYPTWDPPTVRIRCTWGGTTREAALSVPLSDVPVAPKPDQVWPLSASAAQGQSIAGTGYVYLAPGHRDVVNPFVLAEGFPGGYACDYLYDMANQHDLMTDLRRQGYDVILLGFANGVDLIQHNAQVAVACIRQAMTRTDNPLVVGGVSMGGLVMRYALAYMEANGIEHNTHLFLTIDTPHRGAYTNLADQWFAHQFRSVSAELDALSMLLDSPANQQFMATWVSGDTSAASPLRTAFLSDLEAIGGYPRRPRRIAVSCGRGDGRRGLAPQQPMLSWSGSPFASANLWTLPEGPVPQVVGDACCYPANPQESSDLRAASDASWEGAPGGQNVYSALAAESAANLGSGIVRALVTTTCSVPTVSALDLGQSPWLPVPPASAGQSPFHDYVCSDENQRHLVLTAGVCTWLLDRVGRPPAPGR